MTVSTLRPNGTVSSTGLSVVGGAGTLHGVLSDDSDSSYVTSLTNKNDVGRVSLDNLTLPAGAVIKQITLRARLARTSAGTSHAILSVEVPSGVLAAVSNTVAVNWTSPTTVTVDTDIGYLAEAGGDTLPFTDSEIDGAEARVSGVDASSALRIYELYVDVVYVLKPVTVVDELGV